MSRTNEPFEYGLVYWPRESENPLPVDTREVECPHCFAEPDSLCMSGRDRRFLRRPYEHAAMFIVHDARFWVALGARDERQRLAATLDPKLVNAVDKQPQLQPQPRLRAVKDAG